MFEPLSLRGGAFFGVDHSLAGFRNKRIKEARDEDLLANLKVRNKYFAQVAAFGNSVVEPGLKLQVMVADVSQKINAFLNTVNDAQSTVDSDQNIFKPNKLDLSPLSIKWNELVSAVNPYLTGPNQSMLDDNDASQLKQMISNQLMAPLQKLRVDIASKTQDIDGVVINADVLFGKEQDSIINQIEASWYLPVKYGPQRSGINMGIAGVPSNLPPGTGPAMGTFGFPNPFGAQAPPGQLPTPNPSQPPTPVSRAQTPAGRIQSPAGRIQSPRGLPMPNLDLGSPALSPTQRTNQLSQIQFPRGLDLTEMRQSLIEPASPSPVVPENLQAAFSRAQQRSEDAPTPARRLQLQADSQEESAIIAEIRDLEDYRDSLDDDDAIAEAEDEIEEKMQELRNLRQNPEQEAVPEEQEPKKVMSTTEMLSDWKEKTRESEESVKTRLKAKLKQAKRDNVPIDEEAISNRFDAYIQKNNDAADELRENYENGLTQEQVQLYEQMVERMKDFGNQFVNDVGNPQPGSAPVSPSQDTTMTQGQRDYRAAQRVVSGQKYKIIETSDGMKLDNIEDFIPLSAAQIAAKLGDFRQTALTKSQIQQLLRKYNYRGSIHKTKSELVTALSITIANMENKFLGEGRSKFLNIPTTNMFGKVGKGRKGKTDYSGPMEQPQTPRPRRSVGSAPRPRSRASRGLPQESFEGFNDAGNDLFMKPQPMQSKTELMMTENAHMPILSGNKGLPKIYGMENKLKNMGYYKPKF